jgi:Family of unknown function (DUF5760)
MNNSITKDDLANLIRNYVHYDNLASTLNKQTQNARIVRDDFEQRIITELRNKKMENAIIQIVGGKLKIVEEKTNSPLNYKFLEESLHAYFQNKKISDDTINIVKFVKAQRTNQSSFKLKKILQLPEQQPEKA